ncbi:MAG TPA: SDR family oxidoreductase [Flavisolibacter sp.]|nr:SDR family oxidoreductase [Flavisolibacter sp.]
MSTRQISRGANGKVVVITGASSGAGRAIAVELAKQGARLILAARREEALNEVVEECNSLGGTAISVMADTRFTDNMQELARAAYRTGGRIDMWVNNAGVLAAGEFEKLPAQVNEEVIRTNLVGYMNGAYAVLPYFKNQGYGILVNNISVGGWIVTPYAASYTASKFGLRGFFESLKGELQNFPNIHVCDLYPGFLDTPGMQHAANYTGKYLKPAPPVYDPRRVGRAVINLFRLPESTVTIGAAPGFLKLAYATFPVLTRNITASVIRGYLKKAEPIENTTGNVIEPVEFGYNIDGGWSNAPAKHVLGKALLAVSIIAGLVLLQRK